MMGCCWYSREAREFSTTDEPERHAELKRFTIFSLFFTPHLNASFSYPLQNYVNLKSFTNAQQEIDA